MLKCKAIYVYTEPPFVDPHVFWVNTKRNKRKRHGQQTGKQLVRQPNRQAGMQADRRANNSFLHIHILQNNYASIKKKIICNEGGGEEMRSTQEIGATT